jgi:hypothetical protein
MILKKYIDKKICPICNKNLVIENITQYNTMFCLKHFKCMVQNNKHILVRIYFENFSVENWYLEEYELIYNKYINTYYSVFNGRNLPFFDIRSLTSQQLFNKIQMLMAFQ